MITIKLMGDKQDERFVWAIAVTDNRGMSLVTDGVDDSEAAAKMAIAAAIGRLVAGLEFQPSAGRLVEGLELPSSDDDDDRMRT